MVGGSFTAACQRQNAAANIGKKCKGRNERSKLAPVKAARPPAALRGHCITFGSSGETGGSGQSNRGRQRPEFALPPASPVEFCSRCFPLNAADRMQLRRATSYSS